jgi:hypothetical protein
MENKKFTPIHDTLANITSVDSNNEFNTHPYVEGQVFFATDKNIILNDINRQRVVKVNFGSIESLPGTTEEFYQRGLNGFEGQVVVANSPSGFKLYYVDLNAQLHPLSFSPDEIEEIISNEGLDGFNTTIISFYTFTDDLESLVEPTGISGTYNFTSGALSNLSVANNAAG